MTVKRSKLVSLLALVLYLGSSTITDASSTSWQFPAGLTNVVASARTAGGGYPVPPGERVPVAGTCRPRPFDANHSESRIAAKPGTEEVVGFSKFCLVNYMT